MNNFKQMETQKGFAASINGAGQRSRGRSMIVNPEGCIMQEAGQLPENLMAMLDLSRVDQVRQYGTCGVSRPVASFLHESHRFPHQEPGSKTPLSDTIDLC